MSLVQYSDHSDSEDDGDEKISEPPEQNAAPSLKIVNVNTDSIRTKYRTKAMQELLNRKRPHVSSDSSSDDEAADESRKQRLNPRLVKDPNGSSLSALLPKPKKTSLFGASIPLETMLRMPEAAKITEIPEPNQLIPERSIVEDGPSPTDDQIDRILKEGFGSSADRANISIIDVDVSQQLNNDPNTWIKDLTVESASKHQNFHDLDKGGSSSAGKRKNQITYLAQRARAHEIEIKNEAALGKANKIQSRSKYGF